MKINRLKYADFTRFCTVAMNVPRQPVGIIAVARYAPVSINDITILRMLRPFDPAATSQF